MAVSPTSRHVDRSRRPIPPVSSAAPPIAHVNGSDLCVVRTLGINLSIHEMITVWRRGKAKVNRLLVNAPPEMRTTRESTCPLPYEIVEMIIAHLTHNLEALKACSLTCHSWYIVAVPHLHHTLRLGSGRHSVTRNKLKPLFRLHELGLTPLVREIRVRQFSCSRPWFVPEEFSRRTLRYFSAFTNVQTLQLGELEIYRFVPGIQHYFQHFSPTLRSITLSYPRCTPRQLSHFLSLFSNLDNIEIRGGFHTSIQHNHPRYGPRSGFRTETTGAVDAP